MKFDIPFGVTRGNKLYLYSHALKNVKKGGIVQIIVVEGFCPLKVDITQVSDGWIPSQFLSI